METPICDFIDRYAESAALRLHMPGHKGNPLTGAEWADITEIPGADVLFAPDGIIRESEANASRLFGCDTFYSAEGSSLCIRAMLYLAVSRCADSRPLILAGRNAHRTFISAAALLDFDVHWLYGGDSYLSCDITADEVEDALRSLATKPTALYVTTPDYLGNTVDIAALAEVCDRHGILLIVDCAHGAYLRFLPESRHPIDLGAHLCCTSAHKTLPVLTGGAYLHVSPKVSGEFSADVKDAMALFASTSPSYLILRSLDMANRYLEDYPRSLAEFADEVAKLKLRLSADGWDPIGDEPLKIAIRPKSRGYSGDSLAKLLAERGVICEFSDPDHLVLMLTPEVGSRGLARLEAALDSIPTLPPIADRPPHPPRCEAVLSPREAILAPSEQIPTAESLGRICADLNISCPPAVPIIAAGERITEEVVECFKYYGIKTIRCLRRPGTLPLDPATL